MPTTTSWSSNSSSVSVPMQQEEQFQPSVVAPAAELSLLLVPRAQCLLMPVQHPTCAPVCRAFLYQLNLACPAFFILDLTVRRFCCRPEPLSPVRVPQTQQKSPPHLSARRAVLPVAYVIR